VVVRAIQDVLQVVVAESAGVGLRIGCAPLAQPVGDVPVGGIDGDGAGAIAVFLEKRPHLVAMLGGIALLEIRKAEQSAELWIVLDQRLAAQDIGGVLAKVAFRIVAVRIGVVGDDVAVIV